MPKDDRDILEVLKFELDFIEKGGYGRSVAYALIMQFVRRGHLPRSSSSDRGAENQS